MSIHNSMGFGRSTWWLIVILGLPLGICSCVYTNVFDKRAKEAGIPAEYEARVEFARKYGEEFHARNGTLEMVIFFVILGFIGFWYWYTLEPKSSDPHDAGSKPVKAAGSRQRSSRLPPGIFNLYADLRHPTIGNVDRCDLCNRTVGEGQIVEAASVRTLALEGYRPRYEFPTSDGYDNWRLYAIQETTQWGLCDECVRHATRFVEEMLSGGR